MAEINLEKKKAPIWPWVIGALVLLALIWLIVEMMDRDEVEPVATTDTIVQPLPAATPMVAEVAMPREVEEYMKTCHGANPSEDPGLHHQYTSQCFELLASSLNQVAQRSPANPTITSQLETLRQQASSLRQTDVTSTNHANMAREAAMASAEAISSMQQAMGNTMTTASADEVRQAAQQLQPSGDLLSQRNEITAFFREAGDALNEMARAGSSI